MSEERSTRRGGFVGPLILITLGVVVLLNNLGITSWSFWNLIQLWPILLIAAGLDILLGHRSVWGSLLALVLLLGVLLGALWLSESGLTGGRALSGEEIVQSLEGAEQAEVLVDPGVGTLRIEALPASNNLVEGIVQLGRNERLEREFVQMGDKATLTLHTQGVSFGPFVGGWNRRVWDLGVTSDVPLELDVDLGAGQIDLDLAGLAISALDASMGLGETVVTLPEEGRFEARIEGAIGQTRIIIPEGVAVRATLDTGLTVRNVPKTYVCEDDVCTSPGYESADARADLVVSQAIGNLVIRQTGE